MRRILFMVFGMIGISGCRHGDAAPIPEPAPAAPIDWSGDMQPIADGNNHFALDLYAKLAEDKKANIFFAPYSVHTAMSMTSTGAKGATRDQMVKALHLPADDRKALASGDLSRFYAQPHKDYELSVANAIWGQKDLDWRAEWLELQRTRFDAGFQEADFRSNPDTERQRINHWAEEKTKKRIQEVLLPPQITKDTKLALANAVYFKGSWAEAFDAKKTRDELFHLADDSRIQVPMMHGEMKCGYTVIDGTKIVELPYKGGELSMVVILPKLPDGIPALERELTPETLKSWLGKLKDRGKLEVSIPKFRLETRYELPEQLKALGMVDFIDNADLSGMSPSLSGTQMHVTHKAFVDVNEEGTEAAAVTVAMTVLSADPLPFRADHPFLFLIRDVKHGTILFMGRVMNPK